MSRASDLAFVLEHELGLQIADMFTSNFAKIKSTYNHIVSPHICNNRTQPYVEADAPTLPTFAQWLAGAEPAGNFTAGTDPTRTVTFGSLGGPVAVTASPSASVTASARPLGPANGAAPGSGLPVNVNGNAAAPSSSASAPTVSRVGGATPTRDRAVLSLGAALLLASLARRWA